MEQTLELLKRVHEGDKSAREQLVEENMGLVYTVVRRFLGRGCEQEDLVQIGSIGLLKAIDHFDTSYDVRFSTYAVPMITGEIRRFLRDDGIVKVSRILKEAAAKAFRAREALEKQKGTEPTMEEIAQETGISREDLAMAMEAVSEVESLSQTIYSGDGTPVLLGDRLADREDHNEALLNRMLLAQLLELLSEDEQEVIRLRYFEEQTQVQVAKRLGMTQVQVSRAEKRILKKLREAERGA
ncbi:MAG: SigB/SigF/SigG family RNA polymerase sigma factor [Lachnospiraceae bacterium]|uniref:SigB/SigF/SigG family RNA polymerase sigma factor n=1 Tax=Parablautia sp. Marseille-Q6255 TaxID=3039593 RepID=UPI0024BC796E|nr:SigB/SigF/SigG family RNA polymerase sigma factor [Parablautia sp. Marseille-Q6255]